MIKEVLDPIVQITSLLTVVELSLDSLTKRMKEVMICLHIIVSLRKLSGTGRLLSSIVSADV
jgi:hypothetical protein